MSTDLAKRYEFDRLPRESVKAFTAFRMYLDLGPERSLASVAAKLGRSKVMMEKWSRKYDWCRRVGAHAGYVAEIERQAIESLAREKAIEWRTVWEEQKIAEWKQRCRLVRLAEQVIARWEVNEKKYGSLEGIARLLELASKLGRLASGMEGGGADGGKDGPAVRVEVTLALEKIYGEPLPGEVAAPPAIMDGHQAPPAIVDVEAVSNQGSGMGGQNRQLPIGDSQGGGQSHLTLALSPKGGEGNGSGMLPEPERRRIGETARRGESQGHLTLALSPKGGEGRES
jgi:hypothetical protein